MAKQILNVVVISMLITITFTASAQTIYEKSFADIIANLPRSPDSWQQAYVSKLATEEYIKSTKAMNTR